ncbi:MAG: hypothetical protein HC927_04225 [Deltaproteobacteria bacterium]|nr:hypothetical protein [Deltaproteobacteria bacterium]
MEARPPGIAPANDLARHANGDIDDDGDDDIVFTRYSPHAPALSMFRNLGGGQFEKEEYGHGRAHHVNLGEFDGVPGLEIVYIQLGNGYPEDPRGEPARLHWAAWDAGKLVDRDNFELPDDSYWMDQGDIDLDGREEVLALHPTGVVRVDFDGPTPTMVELGLPRSILMDADGDGDLDYVRYDEELEQVMILHNDGTGRFNAP